MIILEQVRYYELAAYISVRAAVSLKLSVLSNQSEARISQLYGKSIQDRGVRVFFFFQTAFFVLFI